MMSWSVYALVDPGSCLPVYVGCTQNPKKRLSQHRLAFGQTAKLHVLQEGLSVEDAGDAEKMWISSLRENGASLRNRNGGGLVQTPKGRRGSVMLRMNAEERRMLDEVAAHEGLSASSLVRHMLVMAYRQLADSGSYAMRRKAGA